MIVDIIIILTVHEALPHVATNDDVYDGYYIPKGTIVIGNAWLGWLLLGHIYVLTVFA